MSIDALAISVRAVLYIDLLTMFGIAIFGINGLQTAKHAVSVLPLRWCLAGMAALGLVASLMQIVVMAASMSEVPLTLVNGDVLGKLINGTLIGTAWKVRMAALFALVPVCVLVQRTPRAALALAAVLTGVVVATFAWAGHGAMNSGHTRISASRPGFSKCCDGIELSRVRSQGWALSEQQLELNYRGVAVPLRDRHGEMLGALSVTMPMGQESGEDAAARVLSVLNETAQAMRHLI